MIEGKGTALKVNSAVSGDVVVNQLAGYLNGVAEADDPDDRKVGILLTRVDNLNGDERMCTLSWRALLEVLRQSDNQPLTRAYASHLLRSLNMRFFEVEVMSPPVGETGAFVAKHKIHAHPVSPGRPAGAALYIAPSQTWAAGRSWQHADTYIVIEQSPAMTTDKHNRHRPGPNHLAFHAGDRTRVDDITTRAPDNGWQLLFSERHPRAGGANHYAAYLTNTDGYEAELVASDP